jgi:hypothetical protein
LNRTRRQQSCHHSTLRVAARRLILSLVGF